MNMNDSINKTALSTALGWLTLLDDANYESCWHSSAEYFRNGVSLEEWIDKATSARNAVGKIHSRELASSVEAQDVVGVTGKCLVCEYKSQFTSVGEIGERLTLHVEDDGQWRTIGYYLI